MNEELKSQIVQLLKDGLELHVYEEPVFYTESTVFHIKLYLFGEVISEDTICTRD